MPADFDKNFEDASSRSLQSSCVDALPKSGHHFLRTRTIQHRPMHLSLYAVTCIASLVAILCFTETTRPFSLSNDRLTVAKTPSGSSAIVSTFQSNADPILRSLLLDDYKICHPSDWDSYVCKGPEYDAFADKLEELLIEQELTRRLSLPNAMLPIERKSASWGKRAISPFPANTTILAVGNSHTRQVFQALPCQYPTLQLIDMEAKKSGNVMRRGSYYYIEFENHAKLHLVTNNAIFYSRQWPRYLQELVKPGSDVAWEDSFDALVVGKMNDFAEAYNTSFMEVMTEKTSKLDDADFSTVPPPTVLDFAERFSGPIVAHSMFCDWGGEYLHWDMYAMVEKIKRDNVRLINGRQYIGVLGECSSDKWQGGAGTCENDPKAHRCVGARGGHPDLVAWDVVEDLHDLLNRG